MLRNIRLLVLFSLSILMLSCAREYVPGEDFPVDTPEAKVFLDVLNNGDFGSKANSKIEFVVDYKIRTISFDSGLVNFYVATSFKNGRTSGRFEDGVFKNINPVLAIEIYHGDSVLVYAFRMTDQSLEVYLPSKDVSSESTPPFLLASSDYEFLKDGGLFEDLVHAYISKFHLQ